jgi:hypothetical protein
MFILNAKRYEEIFFFIYMKKVPHQTKLIQKTHLRLIFIFYRYEKPMTTLGIN